MASPIIPCRRRRLFCLWHNKNHTLISSSLLHLLIHSVLFTSSSTSKTSETNCMSSVRFIHHVCHGLEIKGEERQPISIIIERKHGNMRWDKTIGNPIQPILLLNKNVLHIHYGLRTTTKNDEEELNTDRLWYDSFWLSIFDIHPWKTSLGLEVEWNEWEQKIEWKAWTREMLYRKKRDKLSCSWSSSWSSKQIWLNTCHDYYHHMSLRRFFTDFLSFYLWVTRMNISWEKENQALSLQLHFYSMLLLSIFTSQLSTLDSRSSIGCL